MIVERYWEFAKQALDLVTFELKFFPKNLILCGVGGSGIVGDVFKCLLSSTLPIEILKGNPIPNWVDENSLIFFISYSGNTVETLFQLKQALRKKLNLICVSSNGKMLNLAKKHALPFIKIPEGFLPREAFIFLVFPLAKLFEGIGLIKKKWIKDCIRELRRIKFEKFKHLVKFLENWISVYSSFQIYAAPLRFTQQLNENCKLSASFLTFPDLMHNEIESFTFFRKKVVVFRSKWEDPISKKGIEFLKKYSKFREIKINCKNRFSELLVLIAIGDWVSYAYALEKGINFKQTKLINKFKRL